MVEPPQFDPETQSFEGFLRNFNDFLNGLELKEGICILPLLLDEESRNLYEDIPEAIRKSGPWEALVSNLQEKIYSPEKKLLARQQLLCIRQKPSEEVSAYARKCIILSQKSHPGKDLKKEREAILLAAFLKGLRPELAREVYKTKSDNFADARLAAEHEEIAMKLFPKATDSASLDILINNVSSLILEDPNNQSDSQSDESDNSDGSEETDDSEETEETEESDSEETEESDSEETEESDSEETEESDSEESDDSVAESNGYDDGYDDKDEHLGRK